MVQSNFVKVSIIIPVYNVENYLHRCLDSIVNQTLKEIEIICIDDGSTDGSSSILKDYANRDSRIKVVAQDNSGQGAARNLGISIASGDYIGFVDSDDWVDEDMYRIMFNEAIKNDSDMHICTIEQFDNETGTKNDYFCKYDKYFRKELEDRVFSLRDISNVIFKINRVSWNKIYRKSFIKKNEIVFSNERYYQDNLFTYFAFYFAKRISFTRKPLYVYRVNRPGATGLNQQKANHLMAVNSEIETIMIERNIELAFIKEFNSYRIKRQFKKYLQKDRFSYKYYKEIFCRDMKSIKIKTKDYFFYYPMVAYVPFNLLHFLVRHVLSGRRKNKTVPT